MEGSDVLHCVNIRVEVTRSQEVYAAFFRSWADSFLRLTVMASERRKNSTLASPET